MAKLKQQGVPRHVSNPQCHAPFTVPVKIKRKNKKGAEGAKERLIRSDRESLTAATTSLKPAVLTVAPRGNFLMCDDKRMKAEKKN